MSKCIIRWLYGGCKNKSHTEKPETGQSRDTGNIGHIAQTEDKHRNKHSTENIKRRAMHEIIPGKPSCSRLRKPTYT